MADDQAKATSDQTKRETDSEVNASDAKGKAVRAEELKNKANEFFKGGLGVNMFSN